MSPSDSATIKHSDLLNRLVINIDTTEEVGRVAQLLVDTTVHQVEGLVCKAGFLGRERQAFGWVQVESIGPDSVVVKPGTEFASRRLDDAIAMTTQEVWSDTGERVGHLVDYCIDRKTGAITLYLFAGEGLRGLTEGVYGLSPQGVVSAGRKRIMVEDARIEDAELVSEGLGQRAAGAASFLQKDYSQTQQDFESVVDKSQTLAEQLQQQTRRFADQTRQQLGQVWGQVQERTSQGRDQLQDRSASKDDDGKTIEVDSLEVWPDEDEEKTPNP